MEKQSTDLKHVSKEVASIVAGNSLTYDQLRKVFQYVRRDLNLKGNKKPQRLPVVLTDEELERLLHIAYERNPKYGLALSLMAKSGLRISEVIKLHVEDILWQDSKIHIKDAKGHKDRMMLLPQTTKTGLFIYISQNRWQQGPVFRNSQGKEMTTRYLNRLVTEFAGDAGIKKHVTPHTLRHTFATGLLNKGISLMAVKELLGHASVTSTEIYAHLSLHDIEKRFNEAIA